MSRQARQLSITAIYHVILRGIDRMMIFHEEDDYQMFLNLLRLEICKTFEIYCYCLMSNHVHLIVKSDTLSAHIRHIASIYAMWFNHKHKRCGYLFQDRFRSEPVEEEGYLLRCFRYILKNPVKAGLCKKAISYKWSSYKMYFNKDNSFVSTSFLSLFFDTEKDFQVYIEEEDEEEYMDIYQNEQLSDNEVRELLMKLLRGKKLTDFSQPEQKQILKEIKQNAGIRKKQLARITGIGLNIIRRL